MTVVCCRNRAKMLLSALNVDANEASNKKSIELISQADASNYFFWSLLSMFVTNIFRSIYFAIAIKNCSTVSSIENCLTACVNEVKLLLHPPRQSTFQHEHVQMFYDMFNFICCSCLQASILHSKQARSSQAGADDSRRSDV
jgi:hypothetical protein